MNIIRGKCVICLGNTLVFSGNGKQKFIELLKEHYFNANQINDNKFLLQFKEKRIEKGICICCAYVIECYVNLRNKFQDHKPKNNRKCSICRLESNLTNGTHELIKDANKLLKNVHQDNKERRLTTLCLDCCFCIMSWNKIKDIITNYTENGENYVNKTSKRKYSSDDDLNSSEDNSVISTRRSPRTSFSSDNTKEIVTTNGTIKNKKIKHIRSKKKPKLMYNELKHLLTVSEQLSSTDLCINDNIKDKVEKDDKMMYDVAYISCGNNDLTTLSYKTENKASKFPVNNKTKKQNISKSRKRSYENVDESVDDSIQKDKPFLRITRKKSKQFKLLFPIIILDDGEETEDVQQTRQTKRKRQSPPKQLSKSIKIEANDCTICSKKFTKQYKLKLHELEHEASFKPVVLIKKENICNINNIKKKEEIHNKLDTLVKQVVDDALTQIENEIGKNIINQVVDDTMTLLENQIQDKELGSVDKETLQDNIVENDGKNIDGNGEKDVAADHENMENKSVETDGKKDTESKEKAEDNSFDTDEQVSKEKTEVDNMKVSNDTKESVKETSINDNKTEDTEVTNIESINQLAVKEKESPTLSVDANKINEMVSDKTNEVVIENKDNEITEKDNEIISETSFDNNTETNDSLNSKAEIDSQKEKNIKTLSKDNETFEENNTNVNSEKDEQNENEIKKSQDEENCVLTNTQSIIEKEETLNKLDETEENSNENEEKEKQLLSENVIKESKVDDIERDISNENKSNKDTSISEGEKNILQNTNSTCVLEGDSNIETLQVSPDCNTVKKKNDLNDNSSSNMTNLNTDDTIPRNTDNEIENILQNLGA